MRRSGQAYVQAFNLRHRRSGPLWQGRFKSSLVDADAGVLAVTRYIDLNPVRAAMVAAPADFAWSSARANLGLARDAWLTPHEAYQRLGATQEARSLAYRTLVGVAIAADELADIRRHVAQERAFGSERFRAMVEQAIGRPVSCRPSGRPQGRSRQACE